MSNPDARYQKSRAAIIDASIQLLLSNPDASMSEIALAAGVGRATLYRHYETRSELLNELVMLCLEETDLALQPIKEQGLRGLEAIVRSIDLIAPLTDRFRFLMNASGLTTLDRRVTRRYQQQLDELVGYVEEAKQTGDIAQTLPTAWVVASYDALLNAAWMLVQQGTLSSCDATEAFKASFVSSLQDRRAPRNDGTT